MAMHRLPLLLAAALVMAACAAAQDAAPASAAASTATSDLVCTVQIQISTAVFGCPTIDPSIGVPPGGFECPDSCKRARAAWAPGCIDPDRQLELLTLERDLLSLPEYNETELINLQNALCALGVIEKLTCGDDVPPADKTPSDEACLMQQSAIAENSGCPLVSDLYQPLPASGFVCKAACQASLLSVDAGCRDPKRAVELYTSLFEGIEGGPLSEDLLTNMRALLDWQYNCANGMLPVAA